MNINTLPQKRDLRLLPTQPSEELITRVKQDTGLLMVLIEATSFQLEKVRSFTTGADRIKLNNLKSHLDGVIAQHRQAEKKANPGGYDNYDYAFDKSAETIIELISALQKGEIKVEQTSTDKAA
jgi:hypothetical protein